MTYSKGSSPHKVKAPKAVSGRVEAIAGKSRILFDPELLSSTDVVQLDVLPLFFDRVLVPDPTGANLNRWGLDPVRLGLLADADIATPIATGSSPLTEFLESRQLARKDILPDEEFYVLYERAVGEDQRDPRLEGLCSELSELMKREVTVDSLAFNANWDFLVSMALSAPIASSSSSRRLWEYKLSLIGEPPPPNAPTKETSAEAAVSFLKEYTLKVPSQLTIDDLKNLRSEKVAHDFRTWFSETLFRARTADRIGGIDIAKSIVKEFDELLKQYETRKGYAIAFGQAVVAVGLSALIGPLGGVLSVGSLPAWKILVSKAAVRWGSQRWVGIMTDFKRR
jgi:hypothetical protein